MGVCGSTAIRANNEPKRRTDQHILSMIRGSQTSAETIGHARMVRHMDLWDEYSTHREVLGIGLNGPVYKIFSKRDPSLCYALKEVKVSRPKSPASGPSRSILVGMVLNELQVCLQLDHFHIARVYEVYESATSVFLVMELCSGGELYGRLRANDRFNEIETIYLTTQIIKAINYMHALDFVHGDLKLENFLFASAGVGIFKTPLKLIDFGFSHLGSDNRPRRIICGSPQYMAPEKFHRGSPETTKSDMWSIGVITFMLLTGKAPFAGQTIDEMKHYFDGASSIQLPVKKALERYQVSADGVDFVLRLLERNPESRFSARDALNHRWLASMEIRRMHSRITVESDMRGCLNVLVEFSKLGALRRACLGLFAMYGPPLTTLLTAPAVFDAIDTNNDGFIQLSELGDAFRNNGILVTPGAVFQAIDLVGDGRINFSEFMAATDVYETIRKIGNGTLPGPYVAIIESIFRKLDVDKSGTISQQNLLALFGKRGYKGTRTTELIKEGDIVGDGVISLDEFFSLIKYGGR